mgnify:CR=1 FL=1
MTTDIRYIRQINKIGNEKCICFFIEENNCEGYIINGRRLDNLKKVFLPKGIELCVPYKVKYFLIQKVDFIRRNNYNYNKKKTIIQI